LLWLLTISNLVIVLFVVDLIDGQPLIMGDMTYKLAELCTTIFEASSKCDCDATQASKEILLLFSIFPKLDDVLDTLAAWRVEVRYEWNEFWEEIDSLAPGLGNHTAFHSTDIGRQITWKRIQLISNELQHLVIKLRAK
jgi:hypothetical protein